MNNCILALDVGTKRIGVAISHGVVAEALKPVDNNSEALGIIDKIIDEQKVETVVVGVALKKDGAETEMSMYARDFADKLQAKSEVKIEFVEEAFSTTQAQETLAKGGSIDSDSAKIILEQFLPR